MYIKYSQKSQTHITKLSFLCAIKHNTNKNVFNVGNKLRLKQQMTSINTDKLYINRQTRTIFTYSLT